MYLFFRFDGLIILETYTTAVNEIQMPPFLTMGNEITGNLNYSMYRLSRKEGTSNLSDSDYDYGRVPRSLMSDPTKLAQLTSQSSDTGEWNSEFRRRTPSAPYTKAVKRQQPSTTFSDSE